MQHTAIGRTLGSIELGDPQPFKSLVAVPIIGGASPVLQYAGLAQALGEGTLQVREVSEAGAVPNLMVLNQSNVPVLVIDGEELSGAKQNRVLNTSVLIPAHQTLTLPVSCTEQGRWAYTSQTFEDSGVVAASSVRTRKSRSVQRSVAEGRGYRSDQADVWSAIDELSKEAEVASPTRAMRDVYESMETRIEECVAAVPLLEDQRGLAVVLGGEVAGLDWVSRPAAYAKLHDKLVRSYAVDAAVSQQAADDGPNTAPVRAFIEAMLAAEVTTHEAIGLGKDHRLSAMSAFGSALVAADEVVHLAAFSVDGESRPKGSMASHSRRRRRP